MTTAASSSLSSSSSPTLCYCVTNKSTSSTSAAAAGNVTNDNDDVLCRSCSHQHLSKQMVQYQAAKEKHQKQKDECHRRLLETRLGNDDVNDDSNNYDDYAAESLSSLQQLPDPNQINHQVSQLKFKLDMLRSQSNELALRLTAKTVENDEREEQLQITATKVQLARERLDRMRQCLLMQSEDKCIDNGQCQIGGGLRDALVSGTQQIQTLRFQFACKVFDMHSLDVGEQYKDSSSTPNNKNNESATGIGKIGNLPLPHAGPVLYGVIPRMILASSFRWVASLTQLVARCLGVVLPHPILVCSKECHQCGCLYDYMGDVANDELNDADDSDDEYAIDDGLKQIICSDCLLSNDGQTTTTQRSQPPIRSFSSSSTQSSQKRSSLLKFVGSSARKAISITTSATARVITHMHSSSSLDPAEQFASNIHSNPTMQYNNNAASTKNKEGVLMSAESISRRINHASYAYLKESNDKSATEYVLDPPRWNDEGNVSTARNNIGYAPDNNSEARDANKSQGTFSNRQEFHIAEERFATGLQLLQNDVVALCVRVGVDVETLWPAESLLLNLHSLWCHCQKMVKTK